jgi:hypothetical protein
MIGWDKIAERIDDLVAKTPRDLVWDLKSAASGVFTDRPAGYFLQPDTHVVAVGGELAAADFARCKAAAARAAGRDHVRAALLDDGRASSGEWVKVAYSPTVRRAGEALQFFPGDYPGGVPNYPSPLASMLASALVGGGLGYGAGWLGEKLLPRGYGKKLKRTGAVLGALGGAAPGALWALGNYRTGHSITDPWPFAGPPSESLADAAPDVSLYLPEPEKQGGYPPRGRWVAANGYAKLCRAPDVELGKDYRRATSAFVKRAQLFGDYGADFAAPRQRTPYDVDVNHLGQTLWEGGASQPLTAAALGTMYAAQQMPDPGGRPGWVTGNQLGQLAMNAGKDYVSGLAFGALVNTAVGTPYSAPAFGLGNVAMGLVRAGVQGLFGG